MKIIGNAQYGTFIVEVTENELKRITNFGKASFRVGDMVDVDKIYDHVRRLNAAKDKFKSLDTALAGIRAMIAPLEDTVISALSEEEAAVKFDF